MPGPPGQDKSGRLETVKNTKKVRIVIRLILVAVTLIGFLTLGYPLLAAQNSLGKKDPHARDVESLKIVQYMFSLILKLAGITVTVKGAENIPRDRAVLFVGNHRSYFDILVGYTTVPGFVGEERQLPVPGQKGYQGRSKNDPGGDRKGKKRDLRLDLSRGYQKPE